MRKIVVSSSSSNSSSQLTSSFSCHQDEPRQPRITFRRPLSQTTLEARLVRLCAVPPDKAPAAAAAAD